MTTTTLSIACPVCGADLTVNPSAREGEILPCDDCGSELEVLSVEPLAVDLAPEVEEDWGE